MKTVKDPAGIYQEVMKDIDYKTAMEFTSKWPESARFVEGKQWPPSTEDTKSMPRPVINICDQLVENKRSNILSQQLKLQFKLKELPTDGSEAPEEVATDFSDMAQNTWEDLDQDTLNEDMCNDTITQGTGILYYYLDNNYIGGTYTKFIGKLCGETIDPMDITFGNNSLKPYNVQEQPFFIIRRKKDVNDVIEQAKKTGEDWEKIESDKQNQQDEKYDNAKVESKNSTEVTTYTKMYKEKGEVYWTEVVKNAVVQKPRRLSPTEEKATLYPIVLTVFKRKKKCIYGRGFIEDIIPNQKALNWGMGMQLLAIQQTAWPKILAKVGALVQSITNTPGEILTDHYPQAGVDGIKFMQPPNFSSAPMNITQNLMEMTRSVTGITEVSTGEQMGANMAASAIIALQNQAQKPNDSYMKVIVQSMKQVGAIWEQFYKTSYNMPRPIKGKDEQGQPMTKIFNGEKGRGMEFDLSVEVGPASVFSESLQMTFLKELKDAGDINKYQYVKNAPRNVVPQSLREEFEREEEAMNEQAEAGQTANEVMGQLTPEETAKLQQNPQLLDQTMNEMGEM